MAGVYKEWGAIDDEETEKSEKVAAESKVDQETLNAKFAADAIEATKEKEAGDELAKAMGTVTTTEEKKSEELVVVELPQGIEAIMSAVEWGSLHIPAPIQKAIDEVFRFGAPTKIQADSLPYIVTGYTRICIFVSFLLVRIANLST